ncbi:nitroreductase [Streptomyces thermolineatus]|uniref:nitroreductase n=1 Tax=Streptomyces thermolineatus TaxID=44033 RepID=UPI0031DFBE01
MPPARLVAQALAEVRSDRPVGPDTPAGSARTHWPAHPHPYLRLRPHPRARPPLGAPAARRGQAALEQVLALGLAAQPHGGTAGTGSAPARLRPAASAGGRHPVNAHLLVGPGCSVPPGLYAYDPLGHRLAPRGPAPGDAAPGAVAVLTLSPGRTASHYGHRSWPLLLLDAGHTVAALALAALALDLHAPVCLDADAALLAAAAGLPRPGRWDRTWPGTAPEYPVAAVHVVPPGAGPLPEGPLASWAALPLGTAPRPGPAPHEEARRAGPVLEALTTDGSPGTWWPACLPRALSSAGALRAALRVRRSAPPPLEGAPGDEELAAVLEAAVTAAPQPTAWCAAVGGERPGLLEQRPETSRPAATSATGAPDSADPGGAAAVTPTSGGPSADGAPSDGAPPGGPSADGAGFVGPAPDGPPVRGVPGPGAAPPPGLRLLAEGEARPTLAVWAAGQSWLADCGAVLLAHGVPDDAPPHHVRTAHLAAGCAAGFAQTVAGALGLRSRPVGSWQRADLGAALGREPGRDWVVHGLALGTGRTGRTGRRPDGEDHDRRTGGETR